MTLHNLVFSSPAQIVLAKFFIGHPGSKNVIRHDQNLMADRNQRPFLPAPPDKTVIFRAQIRILRLRRRPGTLGQYRPQILIAVGRLSTFFLPALSLLPGLIPAQLDRCPSDGNLPMSAPISAMIEAAPCSFTPGIVCNNSYS
jgi:hypothetical protein